MSKKNKSNKNFVTEVPEIYNMDDIGYMADEAIHDRATRLENERNRLLSTGRETQLWEVEIAYLRREQQLRQIHIEAHAEYMKKFMIDPETVVDNVTQEDVNDSQELN